MVTLPFLVAPFEQTNTNDKVLERIQSSIARTFRRLTSQAQILQGVALTAGAVTPVPHSLGRKLVGFVVVRRRANAAIWDAQDSNVAADRTLNLQTSATVVVDLLVF